MVDHLEVKPGTIVAEVGPGTGAFTGHLLEKLPPDIKFFAVEKNQDFRDLLKVRFPNINVVQNSIENFKQILVELGHSHVDSVLSGIPWASFSEEQQVIMLTQIHAALPPGGCFVTFAYIHGMLLPAAHRFRKKLNILFPNKVHTSSVVWKNVPPAIVYQCFK